MFIFTVHNHSYIHVNISIDPIEKHLQLAIRKRHSSVAQCLRVCVCVCCLVSLHEPIVFTRFLFSADKTYKQTFVCNTVSSSLWHINWNVFAMENNYIIYTLRSEQPHFTYAHTFVTIIIFIILIIIIILFTFCDRKICPIYIWVNWPFVINNIIHSAYESCGDFFQAIPCGANANKEEMQCGNR